MLLALLTIAFAWLVPNHYFPWSSAWSEGVAISGLLLLSLKLSINNSGGSAISSKLGVAAVLAIGTVTLQFLLGREFFWGDVVMVVLYTLLWVMALIAGRELVEVRVGAIKGLDYFQTVLLLSAVLSIGIALVQWTGAFSLGIYGAEMPLGGRPFGNVAQPNHLCTLCFLGLCGLLWLHQRHKVGGATLWLGAGFLLLGMVMTQSRTGWLQIGLLVVWGLAMRTRASLRISRSQLLILAAVFAAGVMLWPSVNDALLLSPGRSIGDQMRAGVRLPYWLSMLDAIGREPLWGYGWQQVGAAQQRVALDHLGMGILFEHSHNLVLDLLRWNGVPIGGLMAAVLAWWFIAHIRTCSDARVVWLMAAVGGVFLHGMLEFPLEYAYFLIPVGLAMGAIDGLSPQGGASLRVPRWVALSFTALLGAAFIGVATDYFKAEENYRTLRMESARIGVDGIVTPAPELRLLTQLGAFLQFARTEATPGMAPEQVDWMRKVSERFGYAPVMFRYALAAGLNKQPEVAQQTLARLCRIHEPLRCVEAREGWAALQLRYPQLPSFAEGSLGAEAN